MCGLTSGVQDDNIKATAPRVLVERLDLNHILHGKDEPLKRNLLLVLDDHNDLVDISLINPSVESPRHNYSDRGTAAHEHELLPDGFHGARDVLIQSRMTRLEHGCVVLFTTNKEVDRIYLADIKNAVDGNLD